MKPTRRHFLRSAIASAVAFAIPILKWPTNHSIPVNDDAMYFFGKHGVYKIIGRGRVPLIGPDNPTNWHVSRAHTFGFNFMS